MTIAAFAEVRMDDLLVIYNTVGGPMFNTSVVSTNGGVESRNLNWQYPLGRWDLGERDVLPADFYVLKNFFNARYGKAQGFRFKDWADYLDEGQGVLLPIVGSATTVQMYKNYPSGAGGQRKISKPIAGTVTIYRNGTLDGSATVDTTTGIVTPTLLTGTLTWKGQFDWPVRFDVDQPKYEFIAADMSSYGPGGVANTYFHLSALPIVELRL